MMPITWSILLSSATSLQHPNFKVYKINHIAALERSIVKIVTFAINRYWQQHNLGNSEAI